MQFFVDQCEDPRSFTVLVHPSMLTSLRVTDGGCVRVRSRARRDIVVRVSSSPRCSASFAQLSRALRQNLCVCLGDIVLVEPHRAALPEAAKVLLLPVKESAGKLCGLECLLGLPPLCPGLIAQEGSVLPVAAGPRTIEFLVAKVSPSPVAAVTRASAFEVSAKRRAPRPVGLSDFSAVCYDDIGGMPSVVSAVRRSIELPLAQPQVFGYVGRAPHRGLLLKGASGCGKTLLSEAIQNETSANFRYLSGVDLFPKPLSDVLHILRKFADAVLARAPAIAFFDDIDLFVSGDALGSPERARAYYAVVAAIDRILAAPGTVFIGAAKLSAAIPQQLLGVHRISRVVEIPLPSAAERADILSRIARGAVPADAIAKSGLATGNDIRLFIQRETTLRALRTAAARAGEAPKRIPAAELLAIGGAR